MADDAARPSAGRGFNQTVNRRPAERLFGLGLRSPYYDAFSAGLVDVDFVEAVSENFMVPGGQQPALLRAVRNHYPLALHGVSLSIGTASGLDADYLKRLRTLSDDIDPLFISDHLCWTRVPGFSSHDLLPIPFTQEALEIVSRNVLTAQDALGRQILLENASTYVRFPEAELSEWQFLSEMCARTGCGLLLDVNNVYVSATNLGFAASDYIDGLPLDRVRQIHLAGHSRRDGLLIDTHDQSVCPDVWALFEAVLPKIGDVSIMIEWDADIPPLEALLQELAIARAIAGPEPSI